MCIAEDRPGDFWWGPSCFSWLISTSSSSSGSWVLSNEGKQRKIKTLLTLTLTPCWIFCLSKCKNVNAALSCLVRVFDVCLTDYRLFMFQPSSPLPPHLPLPRPFPFSVLSLLICLHFCSPSPSLLRLLFLGKNKPEWHLIWCFSVIVSFHLCIFLFSNIGNVLSVLFNNPFMQHTVGFLRLILSPHLRCGSLSPRCFSVGPSLLFLASCWLITTCWLLTLPSSFVPHPPSLLIRFCAFHCVCISFPIWGTKACMSTCCFRINIKDEGGKFTECC